MTGKTRQGRIAANGLEFAFLEAGEGPLALCLHGFPDSAQSWTPILTSLAAAGYRAVAPWMRGYAPTDIPADGRYDVGALAADCIALHEAFGGNARSIIVGHDWGAMAAYGAVGARPDLWRRCVILSAPPPAVSMQGFQDYEQLRRWWHIFLFQTPMADLLLASDDLALVGTLWRDWSPGFEPGPFLAFAKNALRGEGRVQAALGYYRALFAAGGLPLTAMSVPTLFMYGHNDNTLIPNKLADAEMFLAPGSRCVAIPDAGHFLHVERPQTVTNELISFLGGDMLS